MLLMAPAEAEEVGAKGAASSADATVWLEYAAMAKNTNCQIAVAHPALL